MKSCVVSLGSSEQADWDIYGTRKQYDRRLNNLLNWKTSKKNKELLLNFLKKTEIEGIGIVQRMKYLDAFQTLLRAVNKEFCKFTEKDLEEFLYFMRIYKPKTRHTRWYSIKKFFRHIGKQDLYNNMKPHFDKRGMKLPEELLTEEDIKSMVSSANNIRDKALISVLYESGCRIGELISRRIKHITFDDYGAVMTVDGKTGMRRVRLIQSVPLLANWTENHPIKDSSEAFLWISLNDYKNPIKYMAVSKLLKETAKKANIKKKIYPHLFRHSRATHLANKLTEQQLKIYFGWAGDSRMASTYVHLSGRDVDNAILEVNGIKPDPSRYNSVILRPQNCFRCGNNNYATSNFCSRCGAVLDVKQSLNLETNENGFQQFLVELFQKWKSQNNI